jgi:hypothetical protein
VSDLIHKVILTVMFTVGCTVWIIGCLTFLLNLLATSTGWWLIISYFLAKYSWYMIVALDKEYKFRFGTSE